MNIHPIRTKADYQRALRELSKFFNDEPEPGSEAGARFDFLVTQVGAYEAKHYPIEASDPSEI